MEEPELVEYEVTFTISIFEENPTLAAARALKFLRSDECEMEFTVTDEEGNESDVTLDPENLPVLS